MPVRQELRHLYRTKSYLDARKAVIFRARGNCEACLKPNRTTVMTKTGGGRMFWRRLNSSVWFNDRGWPAYIDDLRIAADMPAPWRVFVVCAVIHLNHTAGDDRLQNLAYLCQWHHLMHDAGFHKLTRCERKDRERPIQWEAAITILAPLRSGRSMESEGGGKASEPPHSPRPYVSSPFFLF